jgi:hypothetical protein
MSNSFYTLKKPTIKNEDIFPYWEQCYWVFAFFFLLFSLYISTINFSISYNIGITLLSIYMLGIILYSRSKISANKRFYIFILTIFLTIATLVITSNIIATIHLIAIWLFAPFLLIHIANNYLIDIPYKIFIKIHTHTLNNLDLFSTAKEETRHHEEDEIYIDIIPQTDDQSEDFLKLQAMYLRLIKFWYTQKNYQFKLRYFFPLLASIGGIFYFFYLLNFIQNGIFIPNDIEGMHNIEKMALMTISLTIFYFTMTHHINSFLHSKFYMNNILDELNEIYFDNHEYRHQIKLIFDKNFLVYIHDKNYDKHFVSMKVKIFKILFQKKNLMKRDEI